MLSMRLVEEEKFRFSPTTPWAMMAMTFYSEIIEATYIVTLIRKNQIGRSRVAVKYQKRLDSQQYEAFFNEVAECVQY